MILMDSRLAGPAPSVDMQLHMVTRTVPLIIALFSSALSLIAQSYKDPHLSIEKRVADLVSRMTVEEKVAQLRSTWSMVPRITGALLADPHKMDSLFGYGIGMIDPDFDNTMEQAIRYRNKIREYIRTKTLRIPPIFLDEAHHGLMAPEADVFPTSIGLACSWDTALVQQIYAYVAAQASARGTNMVLAPVIDVTRDPRWGRTGGRLGKTRISAA
jgi:beta-glucosidase